MYLLLTTARVTVCATESSRGESRNSTGANGGRARRSGFHAGLGWEGQEVAVLQEGAVHEDTRAQGYSGKRGARTDSLSLY